MLKQLEPEKVPEEIPGFIAKSPTGAVMFWGDQNRYLVIPPFSITENRILGTCEIEPLRSLLERKLTIALVLVRLGAYAIGVFKGQTLLSSKVGTGLVHSRHRQGGSSAHRFERHREKQMESFFTRICTHAREQLEPYVRQIDFLLYGGTRDTLLTFRKQCHFLRNFDGRTLQSLLNVREPRQSSLNLAIDEAWSSQVYEWHETI